MYRPKTAGSVLYNAPNRPFAGWMHDALHYPGVHKRLNGFILSVESDIIVNCDKMPTICGES